MKVEAGVIWSAITSEEPLSLLSLSVFTNLFDDVINTLNCLDAFCYLFFRRSSQVK